LRKPEGKVLFLNEKEILKGKKIKYSFMGSPFMAACGIFESMEIGFKNIEQDAQ
jgi:hypothetical protein